MIGCLNDSLACRLLIVRRSSFVVYRRCSSFVVYRRRSSFVVHRWSSFIVRRCSSFVVYRRRSSLVVVHRWSLFIFRRLSSSFIVGRRSSLVVVHLSSSFIVHRSSQGPGAFLQGAGPTAAGYFLGGAIAFGGTEILKRTAIAVLGPQVAIAYSFPVSQSANKSVSQSVSQATCWQLFGRFIDSSIRNASMH